MKEIKGKTQEYKTIECKIDHMDMFQLKKDFIKKKGTNMFVMDNIHKVQRMKLFLLNSL